MLCKIKALRGLQIIIFIALYRTALTQIMGDDMIRIMLSIMLNMILSFLMYFYAVKFPEQILQLIGMTFLLALSITILVLPDTPNDDEIKKASAELKEGEVYSLAWHSRCFGMKEVIAVVYNVKTKKVKLLSFKETPPYIFKIRQGKITPYRR